MSILRLLATLTFGVTVSTTMTFTAGPPTQANSTLVANPNTIVANGTASVSLTFTAVDYYGNLAPGVALTLSASGGNNIFGATSGTTNASGVFATTLTSIYAQTENITASFGANSNVTTIVQFVPGAANSATSSLVLSPNTQIADNSDTILASLTLKDAQGNAISNVTPTFTASGSSTTVSAPLATSASGQSSATYQTTLAQNENALVTAGGLSFIAPMAFVAGPAAAAASTLAASPNIAAGNGSAAINLVTTVRDAQGNVVSGASVGLSASGGNNTFAAANGNTTTAGTFTTTLKSTLMQTETVTALVAGNFNDTTSVTFTGNANATKSSLVVNPNAQTVGPTNLITATLTLYDAASNPLAGVTPTWTGSGGSNTIVSQGATNTLGIGTATYSSTLAQNENVKVTAGGLSLTSPIVFTPGSPNSSISSFYVTPKRQLANNANVIIGTLTLLDSYKNPISGQSASFSASGNNTTVTSSAVTNVSGAANGVYKTGVVQNQNAQVSVSGLSYAVPVTFTSIPALCTLAANPNAQVADGNSSIVLTATFSDANNVPVPNILATFSSTGGANQFQRTSSIATAQGTASTSIASAFAGINTFHAQAANVQCTAQGNFIARTPYCGGSPNYTFSTLAAGTTPHSVSLADLNNDGNLDIIVSNYGSASVGVFLGLGGGNFQPMVSYAVSGAHYVTVLDYNCDGSLDVAVTDVYQNVIDLLSGSPNGTLSLAGTYATLAYPIGIISADVNRDGIPDLIVAAAGANNINLFLGSTNGIFQPLVSFASNKNTGNLLAVADINGDGFLDVGTGNTNAASFSTLLGNGAGSFASAVTHTASNSTTQSLLFSDFNLDGKVDIAVTGANNPNIDIFLASSPGVYSTRATYTGGSQSQIMQQGDLNGDGFPDLIVGNGTNNTVSLLFGNSSGTFGSPMTIASSSNVYGTAAGDLNNDGKMDIVASNASSASLSVFLYVGCN